MFTLGRMSIQNETCAGNLPPAPFAPLPFPSISPALHPSHPSRTNGTSQTQPMNALDKPQASQVTFVTVLLFYMSATDISYMEQDPISPPAPPLPLPAYYRVKGKTATESPEQIHQQITGKKKVFSSKFLPNPHSS